MQLRALVKKEFNALAQQTDAMAAAVQAWGRIYAGEPDWVSPEDHIRSINFAKAICSETARLAMLGAKISITGSARADWLMEQIDAVYYRLRQWVEYGGAYGTVLLKPGDKGVELYLPDEFIVTDAEDGEIAGAAFISRYHDEDAGRWYTRLEYHRFAEDGGERVYTIANRCYVGNSRNDTSKEISVDASPWAGIAAEVQIRNLSAPLFAVLRMPAANNIQIGSPLGMAIFADAMAELRDLDIAYSRAAKEIQDSKRTVLLDSDRLVPSAQRLHNGVAANVLGAPWGASPLPDYVKLVDGTGAADSDVYHEINPELNTEMRLQGINALLSQIGFKCGYSNGYFVFNERSGMVTATQVEADDRRTVQLIKDVRDALEQCLTALVRALDAMADLYGLTPAGAYELSCDFGDVTYNREEDKQSWWRYVVQNRVPFWLYLTKFEGYTEDEARAVEAAAQPREVLFGPEE